MAEELATYEAIQPGRFLRAFGTFVEAISTARQRSSTIDRGSPTLPELLRALTLPYLSYYNHGQGLNRSLRSLRQIARCFH